LRRTGRLQRRVVIVGASAEGRQMAAMLDASPGLGYQVVGFIDDYTEVGSSVDGKPVLGRPRDTATVVGRERLGGVLIASSALTLDNASALANELTAANIHVELSSCLRDVAPERLSVRGLGRLAVVYVEPVNLNGWRGLAKRGFDIAVAVTALIMSLPVVAVAAIAIKVSSRGPVLFRQERVGREGKPFQIMKLRTMVVDAEELLIDLLDRNEAAWPLFKVRDDPRVTRVGRVLRRLSIDELPQLWNVLRGEMSLVGPRPALAAECEGWSAELRQRLRVRPGITGMWQVNGRTDASFEDYTRLDLYYVHNWSLWTDLAMLGKTIPAVLSRRGAA
jgi:exopolysaccharide biosynthesis polyprenyl glycosylphosphotransferase